jgi:hypothetical protein
MIFNQTSESQTRYVAASVLFWLGTALCFVGSVIPFPVIPNLLGFCLVVTSFVQQKNPPASALLAIAAMTTCWSILSIYHAHDQFNRFRDGAESLLKIFWVPTFYAALAIATRWAPIKAILVGGVCILALHTFQAWSDGARVLHNSGAVFMWLVCVGGIYALLCPRNERNPDRHLTLVDGLLAGLMLLLFLGIAALNLGALISEQNRPGDYAHHWRIVSGPGTGRSGSYTDNEGRSTLDFIMAGVSLAAAFAVGWCLQFVKLSRRPTT